jgi:S-adenosylmethionine:tRNA ribosyltransferase-isomerase
LRVSDFDFELPPESIAQRPRPRGTSRLMTLDRETGAIADRTVSDLPELLGPGDVLVLNDTRVVPARLFGTDPEGRRMEILLVARAPGAEGAETWECLAKPGRRARPGRRFDFGAGLEGTIVERRPDGRVLVAFGEGALAKALPLVGTAPLPPYIRRERGVADERDRADYQTVYAREEGAIAAPTAGLHFTAELLDAVTARGVSLASVTLHVGLGTFKPVKVENVDEHVMDVERGTIPYETARLVNAAKDEGRRVAAVGTTTVRTLEAAARAHGGRIAPGPFATDLFLVPGARLEVVDALLTNFHLPRSTLLMLISAFAGRDHVLAAYGEAVRRGYLFFSYGDAMWIA